ncbi:MAG: hypothetical protein IIC50_13730 [Planctomycetes bacterium]|nr:hypothetical protein [Planctomycetota bacterium]
MRAAARTHLRSGLTIMSHTGFAISALEEIAVLHEEGVHAMAWIWTHAQNEKDNDKGSARNNLDNLGFKCALYWVAPD